MRWKTSRAGDVGICPESKVTMTMSRPAGLRESTRSTGALSRRSSALHADRTPKGSGRHRQQCVLVAVSSRPHAEQVRSRICSTRVHRSGCGGHVPSVAAARRCRVSSWLPKPGLSSTTPAHVLSWPAQRSPMSCPPMWWSSLEAGFLRTGPCPGPVGPGHAPDDDVDPQRRNRVQYLNITGVLDGAAAATTGRPLASDRRGRGYRTERVVRAGRS
jgi:hypothetical protein